MQITETKTVSTTVSKEVRLGRAEILALLPDVPIHANITIDIPGGGDWSNTLLDITTDHPVVVSWNETTTKES